MLALETNSARTMFVHCRNGREIPSLYNKIYDVCTLLHINCELKKQFEAMIGNQLIVRFIYGKNSEMGINRNNLIEYISDSEW